MKASQWHQASIGSGVFFAGFSAVHLIDDFLFDVPSEFHLSIAVTQLLALVFMIALVGLIAAASHRTPAGYLGLAIAGALILLAQLLKSAPEILQPGPWHSGAPSELLPGSRPCHLSRYHRSDVLPGAERRNVNSKTTHTTSPLCARLTTRWSRPA